MEQLAPLEVEDAYVSLGRRYLSQERMKQRG